MRILLACAIAALLPAQQFTPAAGADPLHRPFDQILDVDVRDGLVYYRALKADRGRLDRYVASLNVPDATYRGWPPKQQTAFWLDAYNAFVLETVINHYPLHGTIADIPGAFDKATWRAAGRTVTLDQIEKTILPEFKEPRVYFALGRGAIGGGRLRSEAYTAERLDGQLADIQTEFVQNAHMYRLDRVAGTIAVSPIISWHDAAFIAGYDKGDAAFAARSPVERAVVAFLMPSLLPSEKEFVRTNAWKMTFLPMDWRLNDLTGGGHGVGE
ncbi:MAG TPA: DUF547 domain-containing protein [Vicinamibacterales bacterium]|jgi:hypothetical protein